MSASAGATEMPTGRGSAESGSPRLPIWFCEEVPHQRVINRLHRLVVNDSSEHCVQMVRIETVTAANGADADEDALGKCEPRGPWTAIAHDVDTSRLVLIGVEQRDHVQVPLASRIRRVRHDDRVPR